MLRRDVMLVAAALAGTGSMAIAADTVTPQAEPHFVELPEIVVSVIDGDRLNGRLVFEIVIDAQDADAAARLAAAMPRLRATALATGMEFSRLYVSGLRTVDAERLARDMNGALRRADPDIDRVLIVKVGAAPG